MSTQHTPGPWTHNAEGHAVIGPDNQLVAVCAAWGDAATEEEAAANGRLTAAAPDLLVALETIIDGPARSVKPGTHPIWDQALAAIAKATAAN